MCFLYYSYKLVASKSPNIKFNAVINKVITSITNSIGFNGGSGEKGPCLYTLFLKLMLALEFLACFFFFFTTLGITLNIIFFVVLFSPDLTDTFIYQIALWTLSYAYSSAIILYFAVQIPYFRNLLKDVIGDEFFTVYIGDNPGTELITKAKIIGLASAALAVSVNVMAPLGESVAKDVDATNYTKHMNNIGAKPEPEAIKDIFTRKPQGLFNRLWK